MQRISTKTKGKVYSDILTDLYSLKNKWVDMATVPDDTINRISDNLLIKLESIKADECDIVDEMDKVVRSMWEDDTSINTEYDDCLIHAILVRASSKLYNMEHAEEEVI